MSVCNGALGVQNVGTKYTDPDPDPGQVAWFVGMYIPSYVYCEHFDF